MPVICAEGRNNGGSNMIHRVERYSRTCDCGSDTYVCQKCGVTKCANQYPTGVKDYYNKVLGPFVGLSVCPSCLFGGLSESTLVNSGKRYRMLRISNTLKLLPETEIKIPEIEKSKGKDMIEEFKGPYFWLSNFYYSYIEYKGIIYRSVEHAYQASKFTNEKTKEFIRSTATPAIAKRSGRHFSYQIREDWEDVKLSIMLELVRKKFSIPKLRRKLLETGNSHIQEGNWWGDEFWGVNLRTGKGLNHLGKILMLVREEAHQMEDTQDPKSCKNFILKGGTK